MTQIVFIVFCVFIVTTYSAAFQCGSNEEKSFCDSKCTMDSCPISEGPFKQCEKPIKCWRHPYCACKFNYSRAYNGTCIPTRDCPPFPCTRPNEEYVACPPYCPTDDCSHAGPGIFCPLIAVECKPTCRCKAGYWRNNGVCVPYSLCPKVITGKEAAISASQLSSIFG